MLLRVEDIKMGEYAKRKPDARGVYIRGPYDASTKRYCLVDAEDTSRFIYVRKGTVLDVGFTY